MVLCVPIGVEAYAVERVNGISRDGRVEKLAHMLPRVTD